LEKINNTKIILIAFLFTIATFISCKKTSIDKIAESDATTNEANKVPDNFFVETELPDNSKNSTYVSNATAPSSGGNNPNNGDSGIVLGNKLVNPYTLTNMQNAVNILNGTNAQTLVANHLYVRFKPNTPEQIEAIEDNEGLELQDYPMDYAILQDGDYYQDPNQGPEVMNWLYTVVPVGYVAPAGIQYEIITPLFLTDNELLENMAESLAAGVTYESRTLANRNVKITRTDVSPAIVYNHSLLPPCEFEPDGLCTGGGGGGGGTPPTPPLPAGIYVEEQRACGIGTTVVPLRQARIVCKRWFKIWKGYTDNDGKFAVTKKFKNNVKIIVKTKNSNAKVCKVRGIRLWQMLFPCKKVLGVVNNNQLASFRYVFTKPPNGSDASKELAYWAATTTHNSVIEFRAYSAEFGLPNPPDNLKIMVTNWGFQAEAGAAPMWNKCSNDGIAAAFAHYYIAKQNIIGTALTSLLSILKNRMDVIIGYSSSDVNCRMTSAVLKSIVYHELGHAQHFTQAGCGYWTKQRNAIVTELSKFNQPQFHPYGTGNDATTAPILSVGEMWGNHVEKIYADRYFRNGGAAAANFISRMQGGIWANEINSFPFGTVNTIPTLNPNLAAIESFDPNLGADVHRWIPQGLPYDLLDNRNDLAFFGAVNDNVTGYTINQCYDALQPEVQSIPAFRDRLLLNSGNNQQAQANQLFNAYNY
jgi:hypothetical protein